MLDAKMPRSLITRGFSFFLYQFSDRALYTQLQYFEWLFDYERVLSKNPGSNDLIQACLEQYGSHIGSLSRVVEQYLDTSLRRWVDLGVIFSFANLSLSGPEAITVR
jgi:hypothetical protein